MKEYIKYVIIPVEKVNDIDSIDIVKFSYDKKYILTKFIVYPHLNDEDATPHTLRGYKQYTESAIKKVIRSKDSIWVPPIKKKSSIQWKKLNPINWFS